MPDLLLTPAAQRDLDNLDRAIRERVDKAVLKLRHHAIPAGVIKVRGKIDHLYRLRVGKYRILYVWSTDDDEIIIVRIDKRDDVYWDL